MPSRDWRVRKPSTDTSPIDWSRPEPELPPRPQSMQTPWGETFRPGLDGYWRAHPIDPPLSYPALLDKIDRFRLRWHVLRPGVCYRLVNIPDTPPRIAVLWRNRDGSYRAGHVAMTGDNDGVWLAQREPFRRAATRIELWWLGMGSRHRGFAAHSVVASRLGLSTSAADHRPHARPSPGSSAPRR